MTFTDEITSADAADAHILGLANEVGKFAIQVNFPLPEHHQQALERAQLNDWVRLIDISAVQTSRGYLMRVFLVTQAGRKRMAEIAKTRGS